MLFQVTSIEFDFETDDDAELTIHEKNDIIGDTVGHIWEADEIGRAHV